MFTRTTMMCRCFQAACAGMALSSTASAQSLFQQPVEEALPEPAPGSSTQDPNAAAAAAAAAPLHGVSLTAVIPPPPRSFQKHDLVEIIINESSLQKHEQSLETKKDSKLSAEVSAFPSARHLLFDGQLTNGPENSGASVDLSAKPQFKSDGEFERKDRFTARITATVLEVKPNGTILLEARKSITTDDEEQVLVISGVCDPDSITTSNTIQSAQMADLTIRVEHDGEVSKAGRKGVITKVLDTIFNF